MNTAMHVVILNVFQTMRLLVQIACNQEPIQTVFSHSPLGTSNLVGLVQQCGTAHTVQTFVPAEHVPDLLCQSVSTATSTLVCSRMLSAVHALPGGAATLSALFRRAAA